MKGLSISFGVFLSLLTINVQLRADSLALASDRSGFNDVANWTGTCSASVSSLSTVSNSGIAVTAVAASGNVTWDQQLDPSSGDIGCPILDSGGNLVSAT